MARKKKVGKVVSKASLNGARISPRKARPVLDLVRGKQVEPALQILQFSKRKAASMIVKLLKSAIAGAKENSGADIDRLWISKAWIDAAQPLRRLMPSSHGRANTIFKRNSHINLVLEEI